MWKMVKYVHITVLRRNPPGGSHQDLSNSRGAGPTEGRVLLRVPTARHRASLMAVTLAGHPLLHGPSLGR